MNHRIRDALFSVAILAVTCALAPGCSGPAASLQLLTVARQGIEQAQQDQDQRFDELDRAVASQMAGLDAGFDADVRLVATGGLRDATGQPVPLSAEWVVDARRSYTAARDHLATQRADLARAKAVQQDNLRASQEALDLAADLIVQQSALTGPIKLALMHAGRATLTKETSRD